MSQITKHRIEIVRNKWNMCRDCAITYLNAVQDGYMYICRSFNTVCIIIHGNNLIYIDRQKMGIVCINCNHDTLAPLTFYKDEYYLPCGSSLRKIPHSTIELQEEYRVVCGDIITIPEIGNAVWFSSEEAPYNNYLVYFDSAIEFITHYRSTYTLRNKDIILILWLNESKKYAAVNQLGKLVPVNVLVSPDSTFKTSHYQIQIKDYKATCTALSGRLTKPALRIVDDE